MADHSAIEWTDATWNPTTGCTKVSPGCANCYIERTPAFRISGRKFVNGATDLQLHADRLDQPLRWRKPRRVFVNSLSDLFHESVPDTFIARVFETMALSPRHTFQILTKRPQRMRALVPTFATQHTAPGGSGWPLPNVWLGVSGENRHHLFERMKFLRHVPAAVRFVSLEPLLEDVADELRAWLHPGALDWVIVGGESGPGARPLWVPWVRSIVEQCRAAKVNVFVKQLGADVRDRNDAGFTGDFDGSGSCWPEQHAIDDRIEHDLDGTRDGYQGAPVRVHLRSRKGGDPAEWPIDLRVREFPRIGLENQ